MADRCACPCCRYLTLQDRGGFEICEVCFWEDDGQDDHDADVVRGGPNGILSLTVAREAFAEIGACEERFQSEVRPPRPEEIPKQVLRDAGWDGATVEGAAGWLTQAVKAPGLPEGLAIEPAVLVALGDQGLVWAVNHPGWWMGTVDRGERSIRCWGRYGCDLAKAVAAL